MSTVVVLAMLSTVTTIGLCVVVPEWWRERQLGRQARERLTETRHRLATAQLQLETNRQLLIRCREQVVARNLEDIKARDLELAAAVAPAKKTPDAT